MNATKNPVMIMPPVYELSLGVWRWCKLREVLDVVPGVASLARIDFKPLTMEILVSRFVALVRPNRLPWPAGAETSDVLKKKLFRYSLCGNGISSREVPTADGRRLRMFLSISDWVRPIRTACLCRRGGSSIS